MERWKPVVGYENLYEVSDSGRVKSLQRLVIRNVSGNYFKKEKILKQIRDKDGYIIVKAYDKLLKVHRLVAMAFLENKYNLPQVNHINSIKDDNIPGNLEWVSNRENRCHYFKTLTTSSTYTGVYFIKKYSRWGAIININRRIKALGSFNTEIEAYESRVNFEKTHGITNKYL